MGLQKVPLRFSASEPPPSPQFADARPDSTQEPANAFRGGVEQNVGLISAHFLALAELHLSSPGYLDSF